jgi:hypothetical protein
VVYEGERRINLLGLQEVTDLFAVGEGVPARDYDKIRLTVSDPEFVKKDSSGNVIETVSGPDIHLVANGKIDLNPKKPFSVTSGGTLAVLMDFDAKKSVKITETGSGKFILRPVVFVEVLNDLSDKKVQVEGRIVSIDSENQTFILERGSHQILFKVGEGTLAGEPGTAEGDAMYRILVRTDSETRIFLEDGLPGIFESLQVIDRVIVRGILSIGKGLELQARFIKIGDLLKLRGTVIGELNVDHQIEVELAAGQILSGTILVHLGPQTLIFDPTTKDALNPEDLLLGDGVLVEGVFRVALGVFEATTVLFLPPEEQISDHLVGTIEAIDSLAQTFVVRDSTGGSVTVSLADPSLILWVKHEDGTAILLIESIEFADLQVGDTVDLYGDIDEVLIDQMVAKIILVEG